MAIPEPVANTACAEETTLRCGRKEKIKGVVVGKERS